uniref:CC domain-containing protein n=1 Tax=Angiostrongylus cantonensis TaxID=6313 RepID=A0A0K0DAA4_ANGCA
MPSLLVYAAIVCAVAAGDIVKSSPKAIGPCILNRCSRGFMCVHAECVPDPDLIEELGPCVNTLCPETYQCNDNICIRPMQVAISARARANSDPIGPCVNDTCPDHYVCVKDDNKCYPIDE